MQKHRIIIQRPNIDMDTQQIVQNRWGHSRNLVVTMTAWGLLIVRMTDEYRKAYYIQWPSLWIRSKIKQWWNK